MSCPFGSKQTLCKMKIFQLQSVSNVKTCINKRFAVKNSGICCLALIFNLRIQRMTLAILHAKNQFNIARCDKSNTAFFNILTDHWHELIAQLLRQVTGVVSSTVLKISAFPLLFCLALGQSVHWHSSFYTAALSVILFFLVLVSGNLALTESNSSHQDPTSIVLEHLEWGPGPGLSHSFWPGAWACLQPLKVTEKAWPLFFLELSKVPEIQRPILRVF